MAAKKKNTKRQDFRMLVCKLDCGHVMIVPHVTTIPAIILCGFCEDARLIEAYRVLSKQQLADYLAGLNKEKNTNGRITRPI